MYSHYDKKLLVGDFNTEVYVLDTVLYQNNLEILVKDKTYFKNAKNPRAIELFLTNNPLAFQNTTTTLTGLFDYKLVLTVLNQLFLKINLKNFHRQYKKFNFSDFNDSKDCFFKKHCGIMLSGWSNISYCLGQICSIETETTKSKLFTLYLYTFAKSNYEKVPPWKSLLQEQIWKKR